jgi:hypothetical protein
MHPNMNWATIRGLIATAQGVVDDQARVVPDSKPSAKILVLGKVANFKLYSDGYG